ncbi:pseudouridine synthase [Halothermothrix orenii]|uniref:Pseudouridine synthase n=1 Tax=Halothermothrix orenii (strain H 168 / OCM 544 / DSM 9562) TaxID=373903 RepID=B8CW11_HALOH|nr:pseudouridine synthase [Halothermothrix orenii]ACL69480.1 ribosomal large subunit pseudouridine synthase B [Halothermothrix orenii H 168]
MERLQKYMAHAGVASRRKSEKIITQGRVKVNGKIVTELGTKIDPDKDIVEVDGRVISKEKYVYILLNKPVGYITSVSDPHGRKTVTGLIKGVSQRIYPVGRLDYDTSGLLILTNDGELTYVLTHPSHMVEKTYRVEVKGFPSDEVLKKLETGVKLKDGLTAPARVSAVKRKEKNTIFNLTIHEGRNRQVRRMCDKIGFPVVNLKRIAFGPLNLKGLKTGQYRFLTEKEVKALKNIKE